MTTILKATSTLCYRDELAQMTHVESKAAHQVCSVINGLILSCKVVVWSVLLTN